jgi:hypothetical protein
MQSTSRQSEQMQKEAFTKSISMSLGFAKILEASGKHKSGESSSHQSKEKDSSASEAVVWEAQGGNTLLCAK